MQKLARRTAEAQRNAANRAKRKALGEAKTAFESRMRETKSTLGEVAKNLRTARVQRRENWELGPLAPLRNVDGHFGHATMGSSRMALTEPLKPQEIEARCAWAGGARYLNIVVGDRVVVTEGPDKGAIDKISKIDMTTATVQLQSAARRLIKVPELYRQMDRQMGQTSAMPANIPISAIRLVHPLEDPETGVTRDVVVRSLSRGKVTWHRHASYRVWTRYITGLNVAIPWPEREAKVREDQADDTRRADVETPTFMPTLLRPPMPEAVIDELRNRYSKFRTRHEHAFVERKEAEEALRRDARKLQRDMLTPLQEFNRQERDLRRARGAPVLSDDMLAKIGQVIARNKADALAGAGLSEVPPATTTTATPPPSSA